MEVASQEAAASLQSAVPHDPDAASRRVARHSKRLTLTFPILSPSTAAERQGSPSPGVSTPALSEQSASPNKADFAFPSPTVDSAGFLTALAAQERKVLELKEELQRAETDLTKLKRQWAIYEANKKKSEIRRVETLQPITGSPNTAAVIESEAARREQLKKLERPVRKTAQRVFSGSKHTRALSLLSPTIGQYSGSSSFEDILSPSKVATAEEAGLASPSSEQQALDYVSTTFNKTYKEINRRSLPPPSRDVLVKTGKQMASDIKEGFWTFFEDIRQATVGEEGINATENRTQNQRPGIRSTQSGLDTRKGLPQSQNGNLQRSASVQIKSGSAKKDNSFWTEFGLETPEQKRTKPVAAQKPLDGADSTAQTEADQDDHWDMWDSPAVPTTTAKTSASQKKEQRQSSSTVASHTTVASSPSTVDTEITNSNRTSTSSVNPSTETPLRTSMKDAQDRSLSSERPKADRTSTGSIPWPEITKKFSPYRLSRTVSEMMKEWEITDPENEAAARALDPTTPAKPSTSKARAASPISTSKAGNVKND